MREAVAERRQIFWPKGRKRVKIFPMPMHAAMFAHTGMKRRQEQIDGIFDEREAMKHRGSAYIKHQGD